MDFFGSKSDNAMFNEFLEALNGGSSGVSSSSLFRTSDVERLKKTTDLILCWMTVLTTILSSTAGADWRNNVA